MTNTLTANQLPHLIDGIIVLNNSMTNTLTANQLQHHQLNNSMTNTLTANQ